MKTGGQVVYRLQALENSANTRLKVGSQDKGSGGLETVLGADEELVTAFVTAWTTALFGVGAQNWSANILINTKSTKITVMSVVSAALFI